MTVYENRLTLVGSLQPEPLSEMLNKPDPQGFFDRHILVPSDRRSVQLLDRIKPIEDEVIAKSKFDLLELFCRTRLTLICSLKQ